MVKLTGLHLQALVAKEPNLKCLFSGVIDGRAAAVSRGKSVYTETHRYGAALLRAAGEVKTASKSHVRSLRNYRCGSCVKINELCGL